jgi:predicted RNase H-like HicB family nuclease
LTRYIGVLEGADDNWGVWLPDIMGCVGAGATADEAVKNVTMALSDIAGMTLADGEKLPEARNQVEIMRDAWVADALATGDVLIAIPLIVETGRPARANISLDTGLLNAIDAAAKRAGLTRSAFLASAAREKILSSV